jgi:hypothetical protein
MAFKRKAEMINIPEIKRKPRKSAYKKPEAVRELERIANEAARKKHPSLNPAHLAPRTHRDDTANSLTSCIVTYITLSGGFASRVNNTGIYNQKLRKYIPGTSRKGLPDILATYKSKSLFIEVKIGRDKMSEAQEKIRNEQEKSGGLYFLARNFTDFKFWFDRL